MRIVIFYISLQEPTTHIIVQTMQHIVIHTYATQDVFISSHTTTHLIDVFTNLHIYFIQYTELQREI